MTMLIIIFLHKNEGLYDLMSAFQCGDNNNIIVIIVMVVSSMTAVLILNCYS